MGSLRVAVRLALLCVAAAAHAAAADDLAKATVVGPGPVNPGDWAIYRVSSRDGPMFEREHDELWVVEELAAEAVLFSIRRAEHVEWAVVPRREGTQPAGGVARFAEGAVRRVQARPAALEAPDLSWRGTPAGYEASAKVADRRVAYEETYRAPGASTGSRSKIEVQLDPASPLMALKRFEVVRGVLGADGFQVKVAHTLLRHGKGEEGPPPEPPPERTDMPVLLRAKLEHNPFAGLQVGARATFEVTVRSARPIGGPTKRQGRIEVAVTSLEGQRANLTFTTLEGEVAGRRQYSVEVPTTEPAALEPHRWIDRLTPMVTGELGSGSRCKRASRSGSRVTLEFESGGRYKATFDPQSPVGFTSLETHIENGIPGSSDDVSLRLVR